MTFEDFFEDMVERYRKLIGTDYEPDLKQLMLECWNAALENQWQPIETAPLDGTVIDLVINNERSPSCAYIESKGWCDRIFYVDNKKRKIGEHGWHKIDGKPTHWKSLPELPKV